MEKKIFTYFVGALLLVELAFEEKSSFVEHDEC